MIQQTARTWTDAELGALLAALDNSNRRREAEKKREAIKCNR